MGWFAVARGLKDRRRLLVLQSLVGITTGHAIAVAVVAGAVAATGIVIDFGAIQFTLT